MSPRAFNWEQYMTRYLRQLYLQCYPPTNALLMNFNRTFLEGIQLTRMQSSQLDSQIDAFNMAIKRNSLPRYLKGKRDLERMFDQLVADYKKTSRTSPAREISTPSSSFPSLLTITTVASEENNDAKTKIETLEKQLVATEKRLGEMEDIYTKKELHHLKKINDMEKEMVGKNQEALDLKKKNEDIANNLSVKEERLQEMEKEMEKVKKTAMAIVENERIQHEATKQSWEEKVRLLEETVKEKSEVLKTCLRMQETLLQSVVNKSTSNGS